MNYKIKGINQTVEEKLIRSPNILMSAGVEKKP